MHLPTPFHPLGSTRWQQFFFPTHSEPALFLDTMHPTHQWKSDMEHIDNPPGICCEAWPLIHHSTWICRRYTTVSLMIKNFPTEGFLGAVWVITWICRRYTAESFAIMNLKKKTYPRVLGSYFGDMKVECDNLSADRTYTTDTILDEAIWLWWFTSIIITALVFSGTRCYIGFNYHYYHCTAKLSWTVPEGSLL